ncbi:MAG: hypothetical protein V8Q57_08210 [Blautia sp.]
MEEVFEGYLSGRVQRLTEYIMDAIDWEANYDPNFKEHYFDPSVQLESTQDGLIKSGYATEMILFPQKK